MPRKRNRKRLQAIWDAIGSKTSISDEDTGIWRKIVICIEAFIRNCDSQRLPARPKKPCSLHWKGSQSQLPVLVWLPLFSIMSDPSCGEKQEARPHRTGLYVITKTTAQSQLTIWHLRAMTFSELRANVIFVQRMGCTASSRRLCSVRI